MSVNNDSTLFRWLSCQFTVEVRRKSLHEKKRCSVKEKSEVSDKVVCLKQKFSVKDYHESNHKLLALIIMTGIHLFAVHILTELCMFTESTG